jgi:hypothetical protein
MTTWRKLNEKLAGLTEAELLALLDAEKVTLRRVSILVRLHQRYNTVRVMREREALLKLAVRP